MPIDTETTSTVTNASERVQEPLAGLRAAFPVRTAQAVPAAWRAAETASAWPTLAQKITDRLPAGMRAWKLATDEPPKADPVSVIGLVRSSKPEVTGASKSQ
jgi:hypothetical protein